MSRLKWHFVNDKTPLCQKPPLFLFGSDEFVAFTMNVDNLNLRVVFQVLTQLGDIHIHRTSVEVVVVNPDGLQGEVALQNLIGMRAEQSLQLVLLGGQLGLLLADAQQLLLGVEGEHANAIDGALLVFLATYTAQDSLNTEH